MRDDATSRLQIRMCYSFFFSVYPFVSHIDSLILHRRERRVVVPLRDMHLHKHQRKPKPPMQTLHIIRLFIPQLVGQDTTRFLPSHRLASSDYLTQLSVSHGFDSTLRRRVILRCSFRLMYQRENDPLSSIQARTGNECLPMAAVDWKTFAGLANQ